MQKFLRTRSIPTSAIALVLVVSAHAQVRAPATQPVQLEIFTEQGLDANLAAQRWSKALGDLGIQNVQFRPLHNGDRVEIQQQPGGQGGVKVVAQLTSRGSLVTSGGQFQPSEAAKLKKWLADVSAGAGTAGRTERKTVFGLTAQQFADLQKSLASPIDFSTKGVRPEKVIANLQSSLALPVVIDPPIQRALAADEPVRDELKGISAGTALAAIVRPAGGVLIPRVAGNQIQLALISPTKGSDVWPIGWPPEEKDEQKIVPALYEFINVDINGAPAEKAIAALQERLKTPMLFDYNGIARQKTDLTKPVKLTPGKAYYKKILESALNAAGLRSEVRVDEAGNPLIWISPL